MGITLFVTVTDAPTVVGVPMHELPEKNSYVARPLAWKLPVIAAESRTDPPTGTFAEDNMVDINGVALLTRRE